MEIGEVNIEDVDIGELDINAEDDEMMDQPEWAEVEAKNPFDTKMVQEARGEEVKFMEKLGVWEASTWEECMGKTGKPPVSTRWVDVDKGRDGRAEIRSRLVARDFKVKGDDRQFEVFAAMPPLEAKRLLFRMAMLDGAVAGSAARGPVKLAFVDIKKAHLNGKLSEEEFAYVQLPLEAGGGVGRLRRWLYGMRSAAAAWEDDYAAKLESIGFARGKSATTVFMAPKSGVRLVVWGDDFTFLGRSEDIKEVVSKIREWYEIKLRAVLGPEPGDDKEVRILNRILRWGADGLTYEGDDKHARTVIRGMNLQLDSKGLETPMDKEEDEEGTSEELSARDAKKYRSLAAVVNFMALDRPELQYAASVLGRYMSKPTVLAEMKLKKVARYLVSHPRIVYHFVPGAWNQGEEVVAWSDSDWAGCRVSRRSTSGGLITIHGGVIKSWANRQGSVALSSGEAEFYAAGKAVVEAMGMKTLMLDLDWVARIRVNVDAEAARSIASRQGIGKIRHLEVRYLWLQEWVKKGAVKISKVWGKRNPADVLTKPLSHPEALELLKLVNVHDN